MLTKLNIYTNIQIWKKASRVTIHKNKTTGLFIGPWKHKSPESKAITQWGCCVEILRPIKQLRSYRSGQLFINTVQGKAYPSLQTYWI